MFSIIDKNSGTVIYRILDTGVSYASSIHTIGNIDTQGYINLLNNGDITAILSPAGAITAKEVSINNKFGKMVENQFTFFKRRKM